VNFCSATMAWVIFFEQFDLPPIAPSKRHRKKPDKFTKKYRHTKRCIIMPERPGKIFRSISVLKLLSLPSPEFFPILSYPILIMIILMPSSDSCFTRTLLMTILGLLILIKSSLESSPFGSQNGGDNSEQFQTFSLCRSPKLLEPSEIITILMLMERNSLP